MCVQYIICHVPIHIFEMAEQRLENTLDLVSCTSEEMLSGGYELNKLNDLGN